ncbi:MAG: NAD-dependent epimerase/dehydratase family protein [Bryobacteraceae bacterium]|nr:NAD-dependent epimerase/dehydratase family protein [Bryobacteraceae bacterium]
MRVLVTGATGYIGSAICDALHANGHQVVALVRSPEKRKLVETLGYEAQPGNLTDLASMRNAAGNLDGVIHAAMASGPDAGAIDRAAVEAMLDALSGSGKPFVYTSGVWVYGDTQGRVAGEVSMLRPAALSAWRPAVEDLVLEAKSRGVASVVVRPGMVFGRGGGFVGMMFRQARSEGKVQVAGDGENHWSSVHVDDLADLYARIVAEPAAGELFVACGGVAQPVRKIALAVTKACGILGKVECVPFPQAREVFGPAADGMALDQKIASTKAARFFGWMAKHPSIFDEIFSGSYLKPQAR